MHKFATRFALLALVGTMSATGGAFAAPGGGPGSMVDCKDPANAGNPACMRMHKGGNGPGNDNGPDFKHRGSPGGNTMDNGPANSTTPPATTDTNKPMPPNGTMPDRGRGQWDKNGNGQSDDNGPGKGQWDNNGSNKGNWQNHNGSGMGGPGPMMGGRPGGSGHWDRQDRDQFRGFFRSFNFAFGVPDFDIRPGIRVPRHFHLRPLPPQIFRYYPYYRGFLFFQTRDGSIVIVDPRSYRIVDII